MESYRAKRGGSLDNLVLFIELMVDDGLVTEYTSLYIMLQLIFVFPLLKIH